MNKSFRLPSNYAPFNLGISQAQGDSQGAVRKGVAETLRLVFARKWLVLAITASISIAAYFAASQVTPSYRATATVLIESKSGNVVTLDTLIGSNVGDNEHNQTQVEFLQSRDVALRVIRSLNLLDNQYFNIRQQPEPLRKQLLDWVSSVFPIVKKPVHVDLTDAEREGYALGQLLGRLAVEPIRFSQLVEIKFDLPNPQLAAEIANTVAGSFIRSDLDARFRFQQSASEWLTERLEDLRVKLEDSEVQLQSYRDDAGIVETEGASMGGNARQMEAASEQLVQARVLRSQLELTYRQTSRGAKNRYRAPAVFNHPTVSMAREAEVRAERRFAEAGRLYGTSHPEYVAAQSDWQSAVDNTVRQSDAVIDSLAKQYEIALESERALERSLDSSRGSILDINRKQLKMSVMEREVATNKQLYETFLARAKETNATSDFNRPIARIIDPALSPLQPYEPWKNRLLLLAALTGFGIAAALAVFLERRSGSIRSTDDVSERLATQLLAAIPATKHRREGGLCQLQLHGERTPFTESIRTAMTSIRLLTLDTENPAIMFTSSVAGEGKSTIAASFAIEQARSRRVVLVDCDLRKPTVLTKLDLDSKGPGVTDAVWGEVLDICLTPVANSTLMVMGSGATRQNSLDVMLHPGFAEMIRQLRARFDVVVIDTPPIEMVSDAAIVAGECQGIVYVVRSSSASVPLIRRGIARMTATTTPLLGVVLNAHDFDRAGRYHGDTSAQAHYGHDYAGV